MQQPGQVCHAANGVIRLVRLPKAVLGKHKGYAGLPGGLLVSGRISHIDRGLQPIAPGHQLDVLALAQARSAKRFKIGDVFAQSCDLEETLDVSILTVADDAEGEPAAQMR